MPASHTSIHTVDEITDLLLFRTTPPTLFVKARGMVSTTGWSDAQLVPQTYVTPPADGILELEFVAVPPSSIVLQLLTNIGAEAIVPDLPDWVQGVRIKAQENDIEQNFPSVSNSTDTGIFSVTDSDEQYSLAPPHSENEVVPLLLTEEEGFFLPATEGLSCRSFRVASVKIPETKTEWVLKCVVKDPFSGKCLVKTKVPVIYTRISTIHLLVRVCVPDDAEAWEAIKDCVTQAIVAGIAVGVVTSGNLAAAAAALKAYLVACLKSKLGQAVSDIRVDLRREKVAGPWK